MTTRATSKQESAGDRCQYQGCRKRFRRVGRQTFCSPRCRAAAFYWRYKAEHGERYAARYGTKPRKRRQRATAATRARARRKTRR